MDPIYIYYNESKSVCVCVCVCPSLLSFESVCLFVCLSVRPSNRSSVRQSGTSVRQPKADFSRVCIRGAAKKSFSLNGWAIEILERWKKISQKSYFFLNSPELYPPPLALLMARPLREELFFAAFLIYLCIILLKGH